MLNGLRENLRNIKMKLKISAVCDQGLIRARNEDSILTYDNPGGKAALFAVADGMGGYKDGDLASQRIVSRLEAWVTALLEGTEHPLSVMLDDVAAELMTVNREIYETLNRNQICGSTLVLLLLTESEYGVMSIGDSRAYFSRGWECRQLTQDDVWENEEKNRRRYSEDELLRHPNHGKLVRAVGVSEKLQYSLVTGRVRRGDRFALCSDGVYKYCQWEVIRKAMARLLWRDAQEVRKYVMRAVYQGGAGDNASLILVKYS